MEYRHALVRRPSPRMGEGLVTHIERSDDVDPDLAVRQWESYVEAFHRAGWTTDEVEPADELPDSVFVEDTMVVYGDLAVISRPGVPERRGETVAAEAAVAAHGYRIAHIEAPGTLDGGDVLKFAGRVWVGTGGRTNADGVAQLRALLAPLGAEVVGVPVRTVLHLKTAVTALPDGTVVGHRPLVDDPDVWAGHFLEVPEESGAHVVLLDGTTVLMAASAPRSAALFRSRGLDVVTVDISEFEKMEGCVTCLSVRLRSRPVSA
ncbi:dimethylargininase [Nocardioides xinjiangensis]|uniref:dimethylargininase n=1 Tax=Nocardioides xinjiangensis TaxID=2817376 RepID=UPI001B30424F|nr:dimethylargininase [Nocardioides sp. SYSU D00778]